MIIDMRDIAVLEKVLSQVDDFGKLLLQILFHDAVGAGEDILIWFRLAQFGILVIGFVASHWPESAKAPGYDGLADGRAAYSAKSHLAAAESVQPLVSMQLLPPVET